MKNTSVAVCNSSPLPCEEKPRCKRRFSMANYLVDFCLVAVSLVTLYASLDIAFLLVQV